MAEGDVHAGPLAGAHAMDAPLLVGVPVRAEELVHGLAGRGAAQGGHDPLRPGRGRTAVKQQVPHALQCPVVLRFRESLGPLAHDGELGVRSEIHEIPRQLDIPALTGPEIQCRPSVVLDPDLADTLPVVAHVPHAVDGEFVPG